MKAIIKIIKINIIRAISLFVRKNKFSIINLVEEFQIERGLVLHVGANLGQEYQAYESLGFSNVVWVEGWEPFANESEFKLKDQKNQIIITAMISDIEDETVEFFVT